MRGGKRQGARMRPCGARARGGGGGVRWGWGRERELTCQGLAQAGASWCCRGRRARGEPAGVRAVCAHEAGYQAGCWGGAHNRGIGRPGGRPDQRAEGRYALPPPDTANSLARLAGCWCSCAPLLRPPRRLRPPGGPPTQEHCSRCGLCDTYYIAKVKDSCAFLVRGAASRGTTRAARLVPSVALTTAWQGHAVTRIAVVCATTSCATSSRV